MRAHIHISRRLSECRSGNAIDASDIRVLDPNFRAERDDDKLGVLDVKVETRNGLIDVEVQVADGYGYDIQCEVVCENGTVKLPDPYAVVRRSRPAGWDSVQPAESMPIMTDWKERFIEAYDIEFCKWVESVHAGKLTGPSSWDGYVACVAGDALNASRGTSQFMKVETMEKPEMYK